MGSLRFLVTRRWLVLLVVVLLLAYACLLLGRWQWHRLESKKTTNAIIRTNEKAPPVPVERALRAGQDPDTSQQYAVVSATGTYDVAKTVIIRYQTDEHGASGVDVVVPLVTASGTALLVDRGWVATGNQGLTDPSQVPAPPAGKVTVTGSVRRDAGSAAQVVDGSARAISSAQIQPAIGIPVYGGFVDLKTETPAPATPLEPAGLPDLSNGPHFFYALQWWFFGLLALFGFGYLAWEEATGRADLRRAQQPAKKPKRTNLGSTGPPSQSPQHASVDGEHHSGQERGGRAEQERRGTAEL